jgi:hypothetical protein
MTNAEVKARLLEEKAILHPEGDTQDPAGNRILKRYWPGLLEEEIDIARAFILKWTSVKNYTSDTSPAAATVSDPMVNGRKIAGTFRGGPVTKELMEELDQRSPARWKLSQQLGQFADMTASGDGQSDSVTRDAFVTTRTQERTGQVVPLPDSAATPQTPGKIVGVANQKDKWGLYQTRKTTEESEAHAPVGGSKTITAFDVEETVEDENLVSEPVLPSSQQDGIIQSIGKRLNRFLRWEKTARTVTGKKVQDSGSFVTSDGTTYWWVGRNCTQAEVDTVKALVGLTDTGYSISGLPERRNKFNLFDYEIVKSPYRGGGGGGVKAFEETWTHYELQTDDEGGRVRQRFLKYTCGMKQTPDQTAARNFIHQKDNTNFGARGKWGFYAEYKQLEEIGEWAYDASKPARP